ncbi:MAG TPA: hypothetical protein VFO49_08830 [Nocardioides sp.]|nr:hypothetical protein [Nocardioides sp.]
MKSAVRRLLAACLLAASLVLVGAPYAASAPARPTPPDNCVKVTAADAAEVADAVFTGLVTSVRRSAPGEPYFTNTVQVEQVYKGPIEVPAVPVLTRQNSRKQPGLGPLQEGERYLFFVRAGTEALSAGACSGTGPAVADQVTRIEEVLGEGRPAVPPPAPEASFEQVADADPVDFTRSAAPGLALVLIGLLGLVVVRRLGRRSA